MLEFGIEIMCARKGRVIGFRLLLISKNNYFFWLMAIAGKRKNKIGLILRIPKSYT